MDAVEITYPGQLGACRVPQSELERLQASSKSPRAVRHKIIAHYRPDALWIVNGDWQYAHLEHDVRNQQHLVISGGSELTGLVNQIDKTLVNMRNLVQ